MYVPPVKLDASLVCRLFAGVGIARIRDVRNYLPSRLRKKRRRRSKKRSPGGMIGVAKGRFWL